MTGATPRGTATEHEAARWVRGMFGRIAGRYDLANHVLSFQMDRLWRAATVRRVRHVLNRPDARVLDICCGTGDLTLALESARRGVVFGSDFTHEMLLAASGKSNSRRANTPLFESDALRLPVRDGALDLLTVAFGFRNLTSYEAGLREMHRVLRPGGIAAILEFSQPPNAAFRVLYNFYSRRILPVIGGALTGNSDAYEYLPESVRKFPNAAELAAAMRRAGFASAVYEYFTGGIVALHLATR
jgi:demethylmenaquinone methyltransferase/2-methoxy-6-polyprenyl-1,4-benzoquinol methylase